MINIKNKNHKNKGDSEEYTLSASFANKTTYVNIYTNRENENRKSKLFKKSRTNRIN